MLQPKTYIQYNNSRIRNVLIFVFFFWFLKSVWGRTGHQNRWKWHFYCFVLLFLMIHGSSRRILQFIAASFGVWGYRNRFLRSIMNVVQHSWTTQVKKKYETTSEIPFEYVKYIKNLLQFWTDLNWSGTSKKVPKIWSRENKNCKSYN